MEMNLNEMAMVTGGGDFCKTLGAEIAIQIDKQLQKPQCMGQYDPCAWVVGGVGGFFKGVRKGIFGGN